MDIIEKYNNYIITNIIDKIQPVVVNKAKGTYIFDTKGNRYIDCFSGISVVNAGHCNEEVIEAAKKQIDRLIHCCSYMYYIQPTADLAEKLAEITPGRLRKSFFANSGAEAIEGALRLAKRFAGKNEFISLQGSFHGRTYAALSVSGMGSRKIGGGPYMSGCTFLPAPYCYRCFFELEYPKCNLRCARALEEIIKFNTFENIAGFIAEPILGEGGIIVPPDDYFIEIKKILDKYKIPLIIDEVQTGFCRTGKMFAIEHYKVEPDILVMAKGIANGFPLSAFITRDEIAQAFKPGDHLSTFGGNPVSCAAALANIKFIEREEFMKDIQEKSEYLITELKKLKDIYEIIGDVRGKGLMIGIELVRDKISKSPAIEEAKRVQEICLDKGILIGVGGIYKNVIRIQPPLVILQDEIKEVLRIIDFALEKISK